jgi:ribosome-interacting GTPase 1
MPANLPAEAKAKWKEVSKARTPQEKIQKLEEFLSLVPKHKGTERLCSQAKRQMALLRREIIERKQRKIGKGGPKFFLEKEGAAQIVILGPTKVGRSSLLVAITNARVEVSDYPYTTREPTPGMLQYKDLQFQIIEAPALTESSNEDEFKDIQTLALARNADGLLLMVDLSQDSSKQLSMIINELQKARIIIEKPQAKVEIEKQHLGVGLRITVIGRLVDCNLKDVENLLKSYRISDGVVKIYGEATLDDVEDAIFESTVYRPAIVIANKVDVPEAAEKLHELKKVIGTETKIVPVSCKTQTGLESLGKEIFESLDIIRVYSKEPNRKEHSPKPFVLKRGAIILDVAKHIHSDFYKQFAYAKVWAERLTFSPQKVGLSFPLEDGDIVEIHTK